MAVSYRVVGGPTAQSDNKQHTVTLSDNVAAGETLVLLVAHSVGDLVGDIAGVTGSLSEPDGFVWVQDVAQLQLADRGSLAFSAYCENGLSSGDVVGYYVKGSSVDSTHMWHGMSPYAMLVALNSGDSRRMVYDASAVTGGTNVTRCPTNPGTLTSADDAVVLVFHSGTNGEAAGWWAQSESGWTEIADAAAGTESSYNVAADARVATTSWTGFSNGTPTGQNLGHILVSYKAQAVSLTSSGRKFPGSAATSSESPWSDIDITSPGNVTADDASNATITGTAWDTDLQTRVLKAQGFDFSAIPDSATITGVVMRINHWQGGDPPRCSINLAQLLDTGGAKGGTNLALEAAPGLNRPLSTNSTQVHAFGGAAETWGNALTPSWVKDADFGVAVGYIAGDTNCTLNVNFITLEVFYEDSGIVKSGLGMIGP